MEEIAPYHSEGGDPEGSVWKVAEAEWGSDIQDRTFRYALRIIQLYRYVRALHDDVGAIIGKQLLRAGTSVGANVAEARSAQSRADYTHKLSIAVKETRESLYWIRLLNECDIVETERTGLLINETDQIIAVLTSIIVKLKQKH